MLRLLGLFLSLSWQSKKIFLWTIFLALYAYVLFKIKPNWIRFGRLNQSESHDDQVDWEIVKDIKSSIQIVSKRMPIPLVCRHQAFIARVLLHHYKIPFKLYIGFLQSEDKQIKGHAWTEVQGYQVTGFCNPKDYVIQAIYS